MDASESAALRFLDVNDVAARWYGWSRDELLAMTIADIRPAEDGGDRHGSGVRRAQRLRRVPDHPAARPLAAPALKSL